MVEPICDESLEQLNWDDMHLFYEPIKKNKLNFLNQNQETRVRRFKQRILFANQLSLVNLYFANLTFWNSSAMETSLFQLHRVTVENIIYIKSRNLHLSLKPTLKHQK